MTPVEEEMKWPFHQAFFFHLLQLLLATNKTATKIQNQNRMWEEKQQSKIWKIHIGAGRLGQLVESDRGDEDDMRDHMLWQTTGDATEAETSGGKTSVFWLLPCHHRQSVARGGVCAHLFVWVEMGSGSERREREREALDIFHTCYNPSESLFQWVRKVFSCY